MGPWGVTSPAWAALVKPLRLQQMALKANRIFLGECLETQEDLDEFGLPVTYVTFAVQQSFKGKIGSTVTIKQYGTSPREDFSSVLLGAGPHIVSSHKGIQLPSFRQGEQVILFLYPDSEWGFTSPVGMGQGKFVVTEDEWGEKKVSNGWLSLQPASGSSTSGLKSTLLPQASLAVAIEGVDLETFLKTLTTLPTIMER